MRTLMRLSVLPVAAYRVVSGSVLAQASILNFRISEEDHMRIIQCSIGHRRRLTLATRLLPIATFFVSNLLQAQVECRAVLDAGIINRDVISRNVNLARDLVTLE